MPDKFPKQGNFTRREENVTAWQMSDVANRQLEVVAEIKKELEARNLKGHQFKLVNSNGVALVQVFYNDKYLFSLSGRHYVVLEGRALYKWPTMLFINCHELENQQPEIGNSIYDSEGFI